MLAQIAGDGLVHNLMVILIVAVCCGIVWALGRWATQKFATAPIVLTVWNGLFLLLGAIMLINFLLSLVGRPFIRF